MDTSIMLRVVFEALAAGFIAPAFAMLFSVPRRYLIWCALGGFVTRFLRTGLFVGLGMEVVIATFIACSVTSLLFIYIAPRLKVPRPVFTVASIIPLVPGIDAYTALLSLIAAIDGNDVNMAAELASIVHHGMRCLGIMLAISLGIAIPPLFFYKLGRRKASA